MVVFARESAFIVLSNNQQIAPKAKKQTAHPMAILDVSTACAGSVLSMSCTCTSPWGTGRSGSPLSSRSPPDEVSVPGAVLIRVGTSFGD